MRFHSASFIACVHESLTIGAWLVVEFSAQAPFHVSCAYHSAIDASANGFGAAVPWIPSRDGAIANHWLLLLMFSFGVVHLSFRSTRISGPTCGIRVAPRTPSIGARIMLSSHIPVKQTTYPRAN